ncbi:GNAT family N-acetyltransferase [Williamsia sp. M5A3_1d]
MSVRLVGLVPDDAGDWLNPALDVYVEAMGYPRGTQTHRSPLWRDHMRRPGWTAVGAYRSPDDETDGSSTGESLIGIAYGYTGAGDQWWHQQLCAGLRHGGYTREQIDEITRDYFELTELHVHPRLQGHRIGEALLARLLEGRTEKSVLLSTPEVPADDNRAWRLYRRVGFADLLRHFSFAGDPRPFAVLGRRLPMGPHDRQQ